MSEQPQPGGPGPRPADDTAHDTAGRLGEHVGRFAALALRRLEQLASGSLAMAGQTVARQMTAAERTAAQEGADRRDADVHESTTPDTPAPASATARADAMVDGVGAQLGTLATLMSHQLRRAAALAREEAEDMWAEAQQIRAARRRDPGEDQSNIS